MQFLKDNWIWFVSPLVTAVIAFAVLQSLKVGDSKSDDYIYEIN